MEAESILKRSIRIQMKNEQKGEEVKRIGQDSSDEKTSLNRDSEIKGAEIQEVLSLKQEKVEMKEMGDFEHMFELLKKEMGLICLFVKTIKAYVYR